MTDHTPAAQPGQDDITTRLRENADLDEAEGGNPQVCALERDAADEIERLRREVAKLRAPVADERAAFEAWMVSQSLGVERDGDSYSLTYARRAWDAWRARAALASAPVADARMVPVEPTPEMEQAAADYLGACVKAHGLWAAMLAAAPAASAPVAGGSNAICGTEPIPEGPAVDILVRLLEVFSEHAEKPVRGGHMARAIRAVITEYENLRAPVAGEAQPYGWLYDWTHSSATGRPDEHYTGFTTDEAHAKKHDNPRAICLAAPRASPEPVGMVLDERRDTYRLAVVAPGMRPGDSVYAAPQASEAVTLTGMDPDRLRAIASSGSLTAMSNALQNVARRLGPQDSNAVCNASLKTACANAFDDWLATHCDSDDLTAYERELARDAWRAALSAQPGAQKYWLCCGSKDPNHSNRRAPDCVNPEKAKWGTADQHSAAQKKGGSDA